MSRRPGRPTVFEQEPISDFRVPTATATDDKAAEAFLARRRRGRRASCHDRPYAAKGLCSRCYAKARRARLREERLALAR